MILPKPDLPQESFVKLEKQINGGPSRRNVYLLQIRAKSFRDGSQDIYKDTESNLGPFAGFKGEIIQKQALFSFSCRTPGR